MGIREIIKIPIISKLNSCLKFSERFKLIEIEMFCFNEDSNNTENRNNIKQVITIKKKTKPKYELNKYRTKLPAKHPINKG